MTEAATWSVADDVMRALLPLDAGASVGFVMAVLQIEEDAALDALEALEAKRVLVSGMVTSSGGTWRCWKVA